MAYYFDHGDRGVVGGRTRGGSSRGGESINGEVGRRKRDYDEGGEDDVDGGFLVSAFGFGSESKGSRPLNYSGSLYYE